MPAQRTPLITTWAASGLPAQYHVSWAEEEHSARTSLRTPCQHPPCLPCQLPCPSTATRACPPGLSPPRAPRSRHVSCWTPRSPGPRLGPCSPGGHGWQSPAPAACRRPWPRSAPTAHRTLRPTAAAPAPAPAPPPHPPRGCGPQPAAPAGKEGLSWSMGQTPSPPTRHSPMHPAEHLPQVPFPPFLPTGPVLPPAHPADPHQCAALCSPDPWAAPGLL